MALALCVGAFAQETAKKDNFLSKINFYGFVRVYGSFDTRESLAGTEDNFYYLPKDRNIVGGVDLNGQNQMGIAALTSRVGLDVNGYQIGKMSVGAKIEADFYAGLSSTDKVTGTAQLRLRQAFISLAKPTWNLKVGQAWHPMAADMPDIFSLNTGAPFGPFSRTPQATFEYKFDKLFSLTGSALWQMQYVSMGPDGSSAKYIKYGCTPEFYFGANFKTKYCLLRAGLDILSIKPRNNDGNTKVSDRITTVSPFIYAQYKKDLFTVKIKAIFAEAGEHFNLNGGYGKSEVLADGSWTYTPTRNLSTWFSLSYGKKIQYILFGGYCRNFGVKGSLYESNAVPGYALASDLYFSKNSYSNMNQMFRLTPSAIYNFGPKLCVGLELEVTDVQYGDYKKVDGKTYIPTNGLATENLHWVINHRIQAVFKYTF